MQEKYTTNFTPRGNAGLSLKNSHNLSLFELIGTFRTLKVDRNGCLDADLSVLDDFAYYKLIVRKSYLRLARLMIENFGKRGRKKCLLIGSPGTGKSMFLIFLLYILVKAENVPIIINFWDMYYFNQQFYYFESTKTADQQRTCGPHVQITRIASPFRRCGQQQLSF